MPIRTICLLGLMIATILATAPAPAATKVFLLAGQSNMVGVGVSAELHGPYNAPQANVKIWSNGWTNLRPGSTYFGPEVTFGCQISHVAFPDDDIYLIKYAVGATMLATQWNPNGSGECYNAFKTTVTAAMQNLTDAQLSPTIAGMLWMQGESDAANGDPYASGYAANLTNLVKKVRDDFGSPDMPFVVGRINQSRMWGSPESIGVVRTAQETVPEQVGHASWIDTDDLGVYPRGVYYEGHYDTQGQIDLGLRFADEFVQTPEPSTFILAGTGLLAGAIARFPRLRHFRSSVYRLNTSSR